MKKNGPSLIAHLRENIAAPAKCPSIQQILPPSTHWMKSFTDWCVNMRVMNMCGALFKITKPHLDRVRYLTLSQEHRARVRGEHHEILSALEAGDLTLAEQNLRTHLTGIKPHLENLRRKHAAYFEERV